MLGRFFFVTFCDAASFVDDKFRNPFYFGIKFGAGSTTWNALVPKRKKQSEAMNVSTPTRADDGGEVWGFYTGYELLPTFALEAAYTHYADAKVFFDPMSLFTFEHDNLQKFRTHTETATLSAKFMIFIPCTTVRAFSSAGIAGLHRKDKVENRWRPSATFDVGINYNFNAHLMGEIGFNYTSGYGESEIDPAEDFMPFLYSGYLRIAYRF